MRYSLKRRVSLILLLTILIASIITTIKIKKNIHASKLKIMTNYKIAKKDNLDHIFTELKIGLKHQLYDNALWNELYYELKNKNTSWLKANATKALYDDDSYDLDFLYIQTKDESYDEYYGDDSKLDSFKNSSLWQDRFYTMYNVDFVFLEKDLYLAAVAPVTANDESKNSGYFVMGRKIDTDYLLDTLKPYFITELKNLSFSDEFVNGSEMTSDYSFYLYYPIKNFKNDVLKIIKIQFNIENYLKSLDQLFPDIHKIILIIFSICILLILFYIHYLGKVLNKLIFQIDYITQGNYTYKIKPSGSIELNKLIRHINQLGSTIDKNLDELKQASYDIIYVLVKAVETKDLYTRGHSERVSNYAEIIGKHMNYCDLPELKAAAILHDIGKVEIDENILNKPGKLTDAEYEIIKKHPDKGFEILNRIKAMDNIKLIIKQHHERYDGKGYPARLRKREIFTAARIIAVADTFDAMTSQRAYRKAMEFDTAIKIIQENSGTQFDPDVVQAFLECKDEIFTSMTEYGNNNDSTDELYK